MVFHASAAARSYFDRVFISSPDTNFYCRDACILRLPFVVLRCLSKGGCLFDPLNSAITGYYHM